MVKQPNIHLGQGILQAQGKNLICPAGLGDPRRVVVDHNDRTGIQGQSSPEDLARIDRGAIQGPAEELLESQHTVTIVQKQAAKILFCPVSQVGLQEVPGIRGRTEYRATSQLFAQKTTAQLQRRLKLNILGLAQADECTNRHSLGSEQSTQAAEVREHFTRKVYCRFATHTGPQKDCQQLRVRKRLRSADKQLLAWPLGNRPVGDRHGHVPVRWLVCAECPGGK